MRLHMYYEIHSDCKNLTSIIIAAYKTGLMEDVSLIL
jgi:hypothetical protein